MSELTPRRLRLMEREKVIEQGLGTFLEVGLQLLAIRDEELYLEDHRTFAEYLASWKGRGLDDGHAYRLMVAAATAATLPIGSVAPTREAQVRPLAVLPLEERAEAWTEAVEVAGGAVPTGAVVAEVVERRRVPLMVPTGGKGHDGPPHPATYPSAVVDIFRDVLAGCWTVLDPFAGVGTIHALRPEWETYGIELEKEWASVSEHTVTGDARAVAELYPGRRFDAVATSPAYGNRLADAFYNAHDPEGRRTYAFDLGRPLDPDNGAGMAFGEAYRELHRDVWRAAVDVLEPGGVFVLNCKDFTRDGRVVPVTGWHVGELAELGLVAVDLRSLPAAGLPYTTAKPMSELVVVFRKGTS